MADISDVGNALVTLAAQTLYPNGTDQPSIAGCNIRLYQGWTNPQQLDADLKADVCHVSVYPRQEERNTTRYPREWITQSVNTPTLTMTIVGQTVTVGGAIPPAGNPHNVMILANGQDYVYQVQPSDSTTAIASALAALANANIPGTTSTGAVITFPSSARIAAARVGITGTLIRELKRQNRTFQLVIWANTPANRDAIAGPLDVALAATQFLTLADQTAARVIYHNSWITDLDQSALLYRRDLFYSVEFATTQTVTATQVTQEQITYSPLDQAAGQTSPTATFNL